MDPILDDLNDAQREAVLHGGGPLLVVAGAGSGKTRVITRRIARLLRDGEDAESILAVTFTNKAAGEMARRVEELGGHRVQVSTFHSACARFLRADAPRIGFPRDFTIYDTYDRDSCLKQLLDERGLLGERVKPAQVGNLISRLKNHGVTPAEWTSQHDADEAQTVEQIAAAVFEAYQQRLAKLGAMDFDDLLLRFVELLRTVPEAAARYRARFRWVLVDELQDTNKVQYELAKELAAQHRGLCVVGDPDQSIYRFRGAEIGNILGIERDFPDVKVVRLEANYRSTRWILHAAQGVIVHNRERLERDLRTDNPDGEKLTWRQHASPYDEADAVLRAIQKLCRGGASPSSIAVFYRSHYLSRGIEEVLRRGGVPYEVVGGLSFFERREIKDLLAYLRVAVNPLDDVGMGRVVNVPPRGLGTATLDKLRAIAVRERMSLAEVVRETELHHDLRAAAREGLAALARTLEAVQQQASAGAAAALRAVLATTGYEGWACEMGDPQDESRAENIGELINDAADFDHQTGGGLGAYLAHVSLLTAEDKEKRQGPAVSLMTIHAAKGLEFDHVLLVGLEEGLLPNSRALDDGDVEEERRLMYVALTRARRSVALSGCRVRMFEGFERDQEPSRFLDEIPAECFQAEPARKRLPSLDDDDDDGFASQLEPELQARMRVVHPVYGQGVVRRVSGRGKDARAVVEFGDGRERTLLLEYAQLRVLPGGASR